MEKKLHFSFETQQEVLQKIAFLEAFKSKWSTEWRLEKSVLRELRFLATLQSTGASTRIEGSTMTDEEIRMLIKNMKITQLRSRDEQEVSGYYEVLQTILDNFREIPLTENYVRQLNGMLLRHSVKDQRHRGEYKNLSNQVVATSPDGTQRIVFRTTEPHLTAAEMFALFNWTNRQFEARKLHPLLIISAFVYEFLSIHPFQDGNGRLSRLLTTLLLLQHGYEFMQYISFENLIEERKKAYYLALMEGQKNRYQDSENIKNWVLFFLDGLQTLANRLEQKSQQFKTVQNFLTDRHQRLLDFIRQNQPVQIATVNAAFSEVSHGTLKNDLTSLTERKLIVRLGAGRGTRYFLPEEVL